uniref:Uncharacterized protein n=1 Tax=Glossina pallidipes TaxID=7398 RepID=A0A1B0ACQ1_GLOPL
MESSIAHSQVELLGLLDSFRTKESIRTPLKGFFFPMLKAQPSIYSWIICVLCLLYTIIGNNNNNNNNNNNDYNTSVQAEGIALPANIELHLENFPISHPPPLVDVAALRSMSQFCECALEFVILMKGQFFTQALSRENYSNN